MIDNLFVIAIIILFVGCIAIKKYLELQAMKRFLQDQIDKVAKVKIRRRTWKKFRDVDPEEYDESCILSVKPQNKKFHNY